MTSDDYDPQLARLVKAPPEGDDWLHEMKYDGFRIGCIVRNGAVSLVSRNGIDRTEAFPEVVREIRKLGVRDAVLDGELAIVLPDGRTSFQALQNAAGGSSRRGLTYFVFDVLRLGGEPLARRPLDERKAELERLLGRGESLVRYSEHVVGQGERVFAEACRLRLEGIISKRRTAPYKPGRNDLWVKTKCVARQEFVIGGFTDPEGARQGLGALLVGYYTADGELAFAGKVGTGFTVKSAQQLRAQLDALEQDTPPFARRPAGALGKRAHWVKPQLVAEVAFAEWTDDGKVRHPSFQGLRTDKAPASVTREVADAAPGRVPRRLGGARRRTAGADGASNGAPAKPPSAKAAAKRAKRADPKGTLVGEVRITHPDRVLYPEEGLTKLDVARYYDSIATWILPHIEGRALTLVRCPEGLRGECFYMKHSSVWAPEGLRRVRIQEKKKIGEYLVADTVTALVGLAQMGVLEIHTWNSRVDNVECPDRMVIDLDPGVRVPWDEVIDAARAVKRMLAEAGLDSYPKTTGGRGLHVVVPLKPAADWSACLEFARGLAVALERRDPARYTTNFSKAGRERKILVDFLRNNRTNTSVAALSTRARAGATVSLPLRWSELRADLDPASFTVKTVPARLARLRTDPWDGYWTTRQRLPPHHPWT